MFQKALLILLLAAPLATAGPMPRSAFTPDQLDAAVAKAKEDGKPIAFINTELDSTCPKCQSATSEALKRMRSKYVLVIKDKTDTTPSELVAAYSETNRKKGNNFPIISVVRPEDMKLLGGTSYKQIAKDARGAFKDLEKEVSTTLASAGKPEEKTKPAADTKPAATENNDDGSYGATSDMKKWTNTKGRTIVAKVISSDELTVTFQLETGKVIEYPLAHLSATSRDVIEAMNE